MADSTQSSPQDRVEESTPLVVYIIWMFFTLAAIFHYLTMLIAKSPVHGIFGGICFVLSIGAFYRAATALTICLVYASLMSLVTSLVISVVLRERSLLMTLAVPRQIFYAVLILMLAHASTRYYLKRS